MTSMEVSPAPRRTDTTRASSPFGVAGPTPAATTEPVRTRALPS